VVMSWVAGCGSGREEGEEDVGEEPWVCAVLCVFGRRVKIQILKTRADNDSDKEQQRCSESGSR